MCCCLVAHSVARSPPSPLLTHMGCCVAPRGTEAKPALCGLLVVQLQVHAVVDLIVCQRDVVLVDSVPAAANARYSRNSRLKQLSSSNNESSRPSGLNSAVLPLFEHDFIGSGTSLCCYQQLEVAYSVIRAACDLVRATMGNASSRVVGSTV